MSEYEKLMIALTQARVTLQAVRAEALNMSVKEWASREEALSNIDFLLNTAMATTARDLAP